MKRELSPPMAAAVIALVIVLVIGVGWYMSSRNSGARAGIVDSNGNIDLSKAAGGAGKNGGPRTPSAAE